MKKLLSVLILMCTILAVIPYTISAYGYESKFNANPTITVPFSTPTIDGVIKPDEGWSSKGDFNSTTATGAYLTLPLTANMEFYYAYSDEGLYFAANYTNIGSAYRVRFYDEKGETQCDVDYIDEKAETYKNEPGGYPQETPDGYKINYYMIDVHTTSAKDGEVPDVCFWQSFSGNDFQYCTDDDTIDHLAGWNGEVIAVAFDFLGEFENESFLANEDLTPLYCFGIFEGDQIKCKRIHYNESEITSDVKAAGKANGKGGFVLECMIPWDILIDDINAMGGEMGLDFTYTKENVLTAGAVQRGTVMLMDRYFDKESAMVDSWGRWFTVCNTTKDGKPGTATSAENISSYGVTFALAEKSGASSNNGSQNNVGDDANNQQQSNQNTQSNNAQQATQTTAASNAAVTTKAAAVSSSASQTTEASQTFDFGIALAAGAAIISGIGFTFSKKKK